MGNWAVGISGTSAVNVWMWMAANGREDTKGCLPVDTKLKRGVRSEVTVIHRRKRDTDGCRQMNGTQVG